MLTRVVEALLFSAQKPLSLGELRNAIKSAGDEDELTPHEFARVSEAQIAAAIEELKVEARRRGLRTIAMVGYDGGRVEDEQLADHVVITRSEHIPRIQEAQASAYHVLRELVG